MMQMQFVADYLVRRPDGSKLTVIELHEQGELLMEALLELEHVNDGMSAPATASDSEHGIVTVELVIDAATQADGGKLADTIARTAIHQIGGATPDWGKPEANEMRFEQQSLVMANVG